MYKLARFFFAVALAEFAYCAALIMVCGWPWSMFGVAAAAAIRTIRKGRSFWVMGTSRWATSRELRAAGMLDGDKGLMIGRLEESQPVTLQECVAPLLSPRVSDKDACDQVVDCVAKRKKGRLVRLSKAVNTAIFAPVGAGKSTGLVIPFLLNCGESCVVVDFKGELTLATAKQREKKFGHKIVILDPFKVVTK